MENTMVKNNFRSGNLLGQIFKWLIYAILIIYCITLLLPLIWMIFTAFKGYTEYYENMFLWPRQWVVYNFPSAFDKLNVETIKDGSRVMYGIFDMISTSAIWSLSVAFLHVFMTTCVAYVIARYKFVGSQFIYTLGIFIMIVPIIGNAPSMMVVKKSLGIYNNMFLTILTQNSTCFSGLHFLILYAAFKGLPGSYSEAAEIDGAGYFCYFI